MPTTSATGRGTAPPAAIPGQDMSLQLSGQTVAWLAKRPHLRELVSSVWDKLADVEQAGDHPGAIAALRFVLVEHLLEGVVAGYAGAALLSSSGTLGSGVVEMGV
jgi:hypothetical protein